MAGAHTLVGRNTPITPLVTSTTEDSYVFTVNNLADNYERTIKLCSDQSWFYRKSPGGSSFRVPANICFDLIINRLSSPLTIYLRTETTAGTLYGVESA